MSDNKFFYGNSRNEEMFGFGDQKHTNHLSFLATNGIRVSTLGARAKTPASNSNAKT